MQAALLLLLSTLLWGVWGVAEKLAVNRAHPFTVQWMFALPVVLTLPVWYALSARAAPGAPIDSRALFWSIVAGLASSLGIALFTIALQSKPATYAVAVTAAYPLITMLIAVMIKLETFSVRNLLGIVLIVVGVLLVQG